MWFLKSSNSIALKIINLYKRTTIFAVWFSAAVFYLSEHNVPLHRHLATISQHTVTRTFFTKRPAAKAERLLLLSNSVNLDVWNM